jgi:CBS domain-containing protein
MVRHEIRNIPVGDDQRVVEIVTDRDAEVALGPGAEFVDENILDEAILKQEGHG